jgi:hypothetical protein
LGDGKKEILVKFFEEAASSILIRRLWRPQNTASVALVTAARNIVTYNPWFSGPNILVSYY